MGSLNVHKFGRWKKSKVDFPSAAAGSFNGTATKRSITQRLCHLT
jgi:hypothetical protein